MNSVLDGTITETYEEKCTKWSIYARSFKSENNSGFLVNVSITLIDKTDGKDPKKRESYWMRTLKTYAAFGLYIENSVWPIPCRNINITGEFTLLTLHIGSTRYVFRTRFFGNDMFFVFSVLFISLLLIHYFM